jgi:hypothetical protein
LPPRAGQGLRSICSLDRCSIELGIDRISTPEPCTDNFLRLRLRWRPRLNSRRWSAWISNRPVSIVVARRSRHSRLANRNTNSPLHGRLGIVIRNNSRFECFIIFRIFAPITVSAVRPWRTALQRERCLPSSVFGPVLFAPTVLRRCDECRRRICSTMRLHCRRGGPRDSEDLSDELKVPHSQEDSEIERATMQRMPALWVGTQS